MNIIDDFKILLNDLKNQFNNESPEIFKEKIVYQKKEYVLTTDLYSQNKLIQIAKKYHSDCEIISEELNNYHDLMKFKNSIVVMDPLDGTHNFLFGLPMWGLSYTVFSKNREAIESYIGLPVIGILLVFKDNKIYLYSLAPENTIKEISLKKEKIELSKQMIAFDNQFYKDSNRMKKNFNLLVENAFTTRISGSSVFDIAMIVLGGLNARIWHQTEIYDIAPAHAFLQSNGFLINMNSGQKAVLTDRFLMATLDESLYKQLDIIGFMKKGIESDR